MLERQLPPEASLRPRPGFAVNLESSTKESPRLGCCLRGGMRSAVTTVGCEWKRVLMKCSMNWDLDLGLLVGGMMRGLSDRDRKGSISQIARALTSCD